MSEVSLDLLRLLSFASPRKRAKLAVIRSLLPPVSSEEKCMDIGTAHGGLACHFAEFGNWIFVDPDGWNLEVAKQLLRGEFYEAIAESVLSQKRGLSVVTLVDTLQYCEDPEGLLKQIRDALKPGGSVIVSGVLRKGTFFPWLRSKLGMDESVWGFRRNLQPDEVRMWGKKVGLNVDSEERYFGPFSHLLQTTIDWLILSTERGGDKLTSQFQEMAKSDAIKKIRQATLLRYVSAVSLLLDRLTPFLPRYAFAIRLTLETRRR